MNFYLESDLVNISDLFLRIAPPTLEIQQNHKNCKGVQSSGTMHQHFTDMHKMQVTLAQGNSKLPVVIHWHYETFYIFK